MGADELLQSFRDQRQTGPKANQPEESSAPMEWSDLRKTLPRRPSAAAPPPAAPPAPPRPVAPPQRVPSWQEIPTGFAQNFGPNLGNVLKGIGHAATHLPEVGTQTLNAMGGAGAQISDTINKSLGFGPDKNINPVYAAAKPRMIAAAREAERGTRETLGPLLHGDTSGLRKALYYTPVDTMLGASMIIDPAAGALKTGATDAVKLSEMAAKSGNVARATQLANQAKGLGAAAKIARGAKIAADPFEWAIKTGQGATNVAGSILRGANSAISKVDPQFFKTASKAGSNFFSPENAAYLKTTFGASTPADTARLIENQTNKAIAASHAAREARLAGLQGPAPEWQPIHDAIDAAHQELDPMGFRNRPGMTVPPQLQAAHQALDDVRNLADQHEMLTYGPGAHPDAFTIKNMDSFRNTVGQIIGASNDSNVTKALGKVYHEGILPTLRGTYQGFEDASNATKSSMFDTSQIQDLLRVGGADKAASIGKLIDFLKTTPNGVGNSIYESIAKADPTIPYRLAAHATRKGNLAGAAMDAGSSLLWGLAPKVAAIKAAATSPGLSATGHYLAGLAGGATGAAARAFEVPSIINEPKPNQKKAEPQKDPNEFYGEPLLDTVEGMSPDYVEKVIGSESGGDINAKPRVGELEGSAAGLGQFEPSAWQSFIKRKHPELLNTMTPQQILNLRTDKVLANDLNKEAITDMAQQNAEKLKERNIPINDATLYGAHWFGAAGYPRIYNAPNDATVASIIPNLSQKDLILNNFYNPKTGHYMTVGEAKELIERKMGSPTAPETAAATGGRIQRASGGRIDSGRHEALVNKLMKKAERAKSVSNKVTEPLLEVPDKAIVKALDMAQQAI